MKKFILIFLISFLSLPIPISAESLKTDSSVEIEAGDADNDAVLADSGGNVYVEFSSRTRVVYESDKMLFNGEILAPVIIDQPGKSPRPRMREIISFELMPDTGDDILFVDRLNTLHQANRVREKYTNPEGLISTARVKLIVPIQDEKVGYPKLWEYVSDDEGWERIGGKIEESSTDGVRIFSASLSNSGVYTVFDEAPAPTEFAQYMEELYPEENMQAEDIPFQSGDGEIMLDEGDMSEDVLFEEEGESPFIDRASELLLEEEQNGSGLIPALGSEEEALPALFQEENTQNAEDGVIDLDTGEAAPVEEGTLQTPTPEESPTIETKDIEANLFPSAPTEEMPDSDLPQTGVDKTSVSIVFPFIAFFVLGTLLCSAWIAFRKKS